ncbi:MAG: hypothetical protein HC880_19485 [Bacteroidia bacterium]|nr:hypothetical protein [Bacteroidia bacterium]
MCGISGFFSYNLHFTRKDLMDMTSELAHRGPDAEGFFFDGICGLGHRRLSIQDLSPEANQPMFAQNSRYAIVFNGEVYNFRELAKQIVNPLRTQSDTEVILELFVKQHARFVYQLMVCLLLPFMTK